MRSKCVAWIGHPAAPDVPRGPRDTIPAVDCRRRLGHGGLHRAWVHYAPGLPTSDVTMNGDPARAVDVLICWGDEA